MHAVTFERGPISGQVRVPGDKSISHRALILGATANGTTHVERPNRGADVLATRAAIIALGAHVRDAGDAFVVEGGSLRNPRGRIDAANSGTTARLLMGLCSGREITATFDGDASLRRRPMERVARLLRQAGSVVDTTDGRLPARVAGIAHPRGGTFALELPSAQLKSAILLANLTASVEVRVTGDAHSRDHTERMLRSFGRAIEWNGSEIVLHPGTLTAAHIRVPGDLSAAAFFFVAAATTPGSDVTLLDIGVNPTRTGVIDALRAMGADLSVTNPRDISGEPVADIRVRYGPLRAIDLGGEEVVRAIDEIPVLAVAAAHADGVTRIRGAADLRTKESDRLATMAATLRACGVNVVERDDGLDVAGGNELHASPQPLASFDDHRVAMSIAALAASIGALTLDDAACLDVSFPGFVESWAAAQQPA